MLESVDDAVVSSLPAKLGVFDCRREAGVENEIGALINVVSTGTGVGLQEAERGTDAIAESFVAENLVTVEVPSAAL